MKRLLCLTFLLIFLFAGCMPAGTHTTAPKPRTLHVFAAASLTEAFSELGQKFEAANPGVSVTFNFAASSTLRAQIEEGAPADVFASANETEMENLISSALVAQDAAQVFLTNTLVVILPADNPAALQKLEDLAMPGIKLVLAAEEVPVGKYARQSLDLMNGPFGSDFKDRVLANVVSNEDSVKQIVAKVQLGEGDAGIVYTSDVVAVPELKRIEIPAELNVTARYPLAPLARSAHADLAMAFVDLVLSPEGQSVLQKWGFALVK